ncbi:hypothetical protein OC842_006105 [Tilletia horrida]|uniref:Exonuclease V n=1 Tax=Tilletia horrida TaxID=155126 RepID=A0AAN6JNN8_9BASI|nr:hypothetical protein OC842_006105 [Tilletia horrida]
MLNHHPCPRRDAAVARLAEDGGMITAATADAAPAVESCAPPSQALQAQSQKEENSTIVLELLADAQSSSAQQTKERPPRKPSLSLSEYASNRGYLSVTDLVSLAWCEFQSLYGVLGGRSLPLDQRPTSFTTKSGAVIVPDRAIAVEREKTLEKGRAIHAELERELYAEQIIIPTETTADKWALRILEVCCGLKNLLNDGICREVRVFGIVEGFLVFGQIDEIEVKRPHSSTVRHRNANNISGSPETPSKPNWASQDEWRREQARRTSSKRQVTLSPSEAKRSQKLDAFFSQPTSKKGPFTTAHRGGRGPNSVDASSTAPATRPSKPTTYLVVSDSKTRFSATIPRPESQTSAKLQCMLYRRMLEELCAGAEQYAAFEKAAAATSQRLSSTMASEKSSDGPPRFAPCDLKPFLISKKLDLHAPLSDAFIAASVEWCTNIGLFTTSEASDGIIPRINTIDALICSLADVVAEVRSIVTTTTLLSEELGLTYRHRASYKRKKTAPGDTTAHAQESTKKTSPPERNDSQSASAKKAATKAPTTPRGSKSRSRRDSAPRGSSKQLDAVLQQELEEGLDERAALDLRNEVEGDIAADAVVLSSPVKPSQQSQNTPVTPTRKTRQATQTPQSSGRRRSGSTSPSKARPSIQSTPEPSTPYVLEQQIIAKVAFTYSADQLEEHLAKVMPVWLGTREPVGVKELETYKCNSCEYRADCEWRAEKAQEVWAKVKARKAAEEEERLWGSADSALFDELDIAEEVAKVGRQQAKVPSEEASSKDIPRTGRANAASESAADSDDSEADYWRESVIPDAETLDALESQFAQRSAPTRATNPPPGEGKDMDSSEADLWKGMLDDDALAGITMQ